MKVIGSQQLYKLFRLQPLPNEVFNTCRHFQFINKASYEFCSFTFHRKPCFNKARYGLCNLFAIHRKPYFFVYYLIDFLLFIAYNNIVGQIYSHFMQAVHSPTFLCFFILLLIMFSTTLFLGQCFLLEICHSVYFAIMLSSFFYLCLVLK